MDQLFVDAKFEGYKSVIKSMNGKGIPWNQIDFAGKKDDTELAEYLQLLSDMSFYPPITVEEWHGLVKYFQEVIAGVVPGFIREPKKPLKSPPDSPSSCWQLYKKKLKKEKRFTDQSILAIEESATRVISQIEDDTPRTNPVRGMVMGNVQSGKTANMAAVIAMAADYGFNMFIILTGTIENLRVQTQTRLIDDLTNKDDIIHFDLLHHPSGSSVHPERLMDLSYLDDKDHSTSHHRYLCVCLKNSKRLKDLLIWLNGCDANKSKLRILLIDDEADQAGVNTNDVSTPEEATAINRFIKRIVFGQDINGKDTHKYGAMNYIGYTATPYGNLLNVAKPTELYPQNFILTLPSPAEYIGPQQVFGLPDGAEGLPIVNPIDTSEISSISKSISFGYHNIPKALKSALLWFVCSLAMGRYYGMKRPFTMLIHTSQRVLLHEQMAESIKRFFEEFKHQDFIKDLKDVWDYQTNKLTIDDFIKAMPNYNGADDIKQYPLFNDLLPYFHEIVHGGLTHILMDDEGSKLQYSNKIHLCVDNCKQPSTLDEDVVIRIVYPTKEEMKNLDVAPGFIVIGGSTLSRGLTLEGLVCSYFYRTTKMADTLMQMGRWFGYRLGYELLPRIWLSNQTHDQFVRLSLLDYNLRHEISVMSDMNISPMELGPKIDSFPDYKALVITAKNKMQSAIETEVAYGNKAGQTTKYFEDDEINSKNRKFAIEFINKLGPIDLDKIAALHNPNIDMSNPDNIWFDVDYKIVFDLLKNVVFPKQAATLDNVDSVEKWFKAEYDLGHLKNWDVILSSTENGALMDCFDNGIKIHMPKRTRVNPEKVGKTVDPNFFDLKTITSPRDMLLDICSDGLSPQLKSALLAKNIQQLNAILKVKNASMAEKRIAFNKFDTPLLVLYFMDHESGKNDSGCQSINGSIPDRLPLGTKEDLFGYYVYIPYGAGDNGKPLVISNAKVSVKLEFDKETDNDD